MSAPRRVYLLSLGCAKNRVDAEVLLGLVGKKGYVITDEPEEADLVVINTCGFIEAARKESVDAILEAAQLKTTGRCKTLMVAGCLVQRYGEELAAELPEVDKLVEDNIPRLKERSMSSSLYPSTQRGEGTLTTIVQCLGRILSHMPAQEAKQDRVIINPCG